jgi:hypothetical protein
MRHGLHHVAQKFRITAFPWARQIHRAPVDRLDRKLRRRIRIAYKPNYRLTLLLGFLRPRIISGRGPH